jgi:hypothetical protein
MAIPPATEEQQQQTLPWRVWSSKDSIHDLIEEIRNWALFRTRHSPLQDPSLLPWLLNVGVVRKPNNGAVVLLGEGPFPGERLLTHLQRIRMDVRSGEELAAQAVELMNPGAVVLGRTGWSEDTLLSLIQGSAPGPLVAYGGIKCTMATSLLLFERSNSSYIPRIYSQEMLLYQILRRRDPLAAGEEFLRDHIQDHEALRFLDLHRGFEWVDLGQPPDSKRPAEVAWRDEGMLSAVGYHVGKAGSTVEHRHRVLAELFHEERLREVRSLAYVRSWGRPDSATRLSQIAHSIARQWRLRSARQDDDGEALGDWEGDLEWLRREFYDGKFDNCFEWPKPR